MKFLLSIGLACYFAGLFYLYKGEEQKKKSIWLILIGGLLIFASCFYAWYSVYNKIEMGSIFVVAQFVIIFIIGTMFYYTEEKEKESVFFTSFLLAVILFITFWGKLPSVTLDNDVIKMSGKYGANFKASDMQWADTVSAYPKVGTKRSAGVLPPSRKTAC